jgi:protein-disulfide isomerase
MKSPKSMKVLAALLIMASGPFTAHAQTVDVLPSRVTDFAKTEAADDHTIGSKDASITLVIWASITCSHCSKWFINEWPIIKSELVETGKLRVVFREYRTAPPELAMTGFSLAECAPPEDYMSIIEYQMENQSAIFEAAREGRAPEAYREVARLAGMETTEAITTCLKNPDISAHIKDNMARAQIAEVAGVPAFVINGDTYKGAQDAMSLVELINGMDAKGLSVLPSDIKPTGAHAGHEHE